MKQVASRGFTLCVCLYIVGHYTELAVSSAGVLMSVCGVAAMACALIYIKWSKVAVPAALLAIAGLVGLLAYGADWWDMIWTGIREMSELVVMLTIIPIVGWVLREEPYVEQLMLAARRSLLSGKRFYAGVMWMTQLIAYFLLVGSVSMAYQITGTFLKTQTGAPWELYKARAILRGFALGSMWVVSIPSFAYALESLNASLALTVAQGVLFAVVGTSMSMLGMVWMERKYGISFTRGIQAELERIQEGSSHNPHGARQAKEFILLFITLVGSIVAVHSVLSISILAAIPPVVAVWTFAYFTIKKKPLRFVRLGRTYISSELHTKAPEILIMMMAGPFIYSLNITGSGEAFVQLVYEATTGLPWMNFLWMLPFFVLLMGYMGLSPMTAMVLIGGILQSIQLPYPPELIVFALTLGSAMAFVSSPFMVAVILLGSHNGRTIMQNSLYGNWMFALVIYAVGQAYLQLMLIAFA